MNIFLIRISIRWEIFSFGSPSHEHFFNSDFCERPSLHDPSCGKKQQFKNTSCRLEAEDHKKSQLIRAWHIAVIYAHSSFAHIEPIWLCSSSCVVDTKCRAIVFRVDVLSTTLNHVGRVSIFCVTKVTVPGTVLFLFGDRHEMVRHLLPTTYHGINDVPYGACLPLH